MAIFGSDKKPNRVAQVSASETAPERFPGQLQVLSFENLRTLLGTEWPKHKSDVHRSVEEILQSELGPWDFSTLVGQEHMLIIYNDDDVAAAKKTASHIEIQIENKVGKGYQSTLSDIRRGSQKLTRKLISERKLAFRDAEAAHQHYGSSTEATLSNLGSFTDKSRQPHEVGYAPMWNVRQEVLTGYAVVPIVRKQDGPPLIGYDVLSKPTMLADMQAIDIEMLQAQIDMAADLMQNNFTALLASQIHFDTLSFMSSRREILGITQKIPDWLRNTLMVQLIGVEENTPASTIAQRTAGLGGRFRAMIVRVPNAKFPLASCKAAGANVVSYLVSPYQTDDQVVNEAVRLIAEAKKNHLLTCFENVFTVELASRLKDLGAIFVTGSFLGEPVEIPDNMQRLTMEDVKAGRLPC